MTEWLYAQAGQIVPPSKELWFDLLNSQLHIPTDAFCSSIERLCKFWELAPHMMEVATVNISAICSSPIFGQRKQFNTDQEYNDALAEETRARLQKRFDETGSLKSTGYDIERALVAFEKYFLNGTTFDEAVRALLESQLALTWTAFETLTEDVWKAAMACHPGSGIQKPKFQRLDFIRDAYKSLSPSSSTVNAVLANDDLRRLNLVRNLIVHKSGKVDQKFLDEAKAIQWNVSDPRDQLIHINGARVKELVNPVVKAGEELIRAVDNWITLKTRQEESG